MMGETFPDTHLKIPSKIFNTHTLYVAELEAE